MASEGWRAFYRGLGASTLGLSHIAIQFPVYEASKASLSAFAARRSGGAGSRAGGGASGRDADAAGVRGDSGGSAGGSAGGARAGAGSGDLSRALPAGGRHAQGAPAPELPHPTWVVLVSSFVSKLLASSATYPHELVRARLQDQRLTVPGEGRPYRGIVDAIRQTVRREGVGALWHGFSVNLVRALPQSMITFGLYEYLIWAL